MKRSEKKNDYFFLYYFFFIRNEIMSDKITKKSEDFVYYICKNVAVWINGLFSDVTFEKKEDSSYKTLTYNTVDKKQSKKPIHYLKHNLETYSFRKKQLTLHRNRLNMEEWREKFRDKWIKSGFIGTLKTGDIIKILILDQNLYDILLSYNELDILNTDTRFFSRYIATYVHDKGLRGKLIFHLENNDDIIYDNFEFHVLCNDSCWYPLRNRVLPETYSKYLFPLMGREVHWDEFPLDTPVGLRGPIILWEEI